MGKVKFFSLHFNNRSRIYHAGEDLTGYLVVDLKESAEVQSVQVCVFEKPCVRYVTGTGPGCCSSVFTEAEVVGEPVDLYDENSVVGLEEGCHTINFSLPLPTDIPSSFESKSSKVQYYLVAEIVLAGQRVIREKTKSSFKVINSVDLSHFPQIQTSRQQQARVGLSAAPIPGRTQNRCLDVVFHVDKGGYVPGEKFRIFGKINNGTNLQVRKSYVELVQIIKLRMNGKVKTVRNAVTGLRHHSIPAGATDVWDTDCLTIPELPPSSINPHPGRISIAYCLQLVVVPAGLNQKVKLPIEIIIGSTPVSGASGLPHANRGPMASYPLRELPQDQFDIINTQGGRIHLEIAPPPYMPADEPPPPYEEHWNGSSM